MTWHPTGWNPADYTIVGFALIGAVTTLDHVLSRTGGAIGTRWRAWRSIRRHRRSAPQPNRTLDT